MDTSTRPSAKLPASVYPLRLQFHEDVSRLKYYLGGIVGNGILKTPLHVYVVPDSEVDVADVNAILESHLHRFRTLILDYPGWGGALTGDSPLPYLHSFHVNFALDPGRRDAFNVGRALNLCELSFPAVSPLYLQAKSPVDSMTYLKISLAAMGRYAQYLFNQFPYLKQLTLTDVSNETIHNRPKGTLPPHLKVLEWEYAPKETNGPAVPDEWLVAIEAEALPKKSLKKDEGQKSFDQVPGKWLAPIQSEALPNKIDIEVLKSFDYTLHATASHMEELNTCLEQFRDTFSSLRTGQWDMHLRSRKDYDSLFSSKDSQWDEICITATIPKPTEAPSTPNTTAATTTPTPTYLRWTLIFTLRNRDLDMIPLFRSITATFRVYSLTARQSVLEQMLAQQSRGDHRVPMNMDLQALTIKFDGCRQTVETSTLRVPASCRVVPEFGHGIQRYEAEYWVKGHVQQILGNGAIDYAKLA